MTDFAIAVEYLLPGSEYGSARNYGQLVATWRDARPVPSMQALVDAEPLALAALKDNQINSELASDKYLQALISIIHDIPSVKAVYPLISDLNAEIKTRRRVLNRSARVSAVSGSLSTTKKRKRE